MPWLLQCFPNGKLKPETRCPRGDIPVLGTCKEQGGVLAPRTQRRPLARCSHPSHTSDTALGQPGCATSRCLPAPGPALSHGAGVPAAGPAADARGCHGPAAFTRQLHGASMPTATPGSERDFMLLKRRLEQIAVFTNKVMEDRMRARIINIEDLAPYKDLPPCVLPGSGCPWALAAPGPLRAHGSSQGRRCRQGSSSGTQPLPGARTHSSAPGRSLKSRKLQSILEACCLPLFLLINFSKMHCQLSPQNSQCRWANPNGLPFVCEPTWPLAESN